MTGEELEELHQQLELEAELVEEMAREEELSLEQLRQDFLHDLFVQTLKDKRERMEQLARRREGMRPLSEAWIRERTNGRLGPVPQVDLALSRLQQSFDRLRLVEDSLENLATDYLRRLGNHPSSVEDRIALYRSW